jgi:hypothetical protein
VSAIVWADVTGMFTTDTTLAGLPVAAQNNILAEVNGRPEATFDRPETLKLARIYMAAAMGITTAAGGYPVAGPVIHEQAGNISRSYALTFVPADGAWGNTTYGRMYFALLKGSTTARFTR